MHLLGQFGQYDGNYFIVCIFVHEWIEFHMLIINCSWGFKKRTRTAKSPEEVKKREEDNERTIETHPGGTGEKQAKPFPHHCCH